MSVVTPNLEDAVPISTPRDGEYKIRSIHQPSDGLAPKDKDQPADKVVVASEPVISGNFPTWKLKKWGETTPDGLDIVTLDFVSTPGLFLSYDFASRSVVLKNDRQPVWILIPNRGGKDQYKISPLTSPGMLLTYTGSGKEVEICKPSDNTHDIRKQLWEIPVHWQ